MAKHVALLRGINVGGHRRISMPDLRDVLAAAGYEDVVTLLQSGNVVLKAKGSAKALGPALEALIDKELGVDPLVVVRTHAELGAVIDANPFPDAVAHPKLFHVSFLSAKPKAAVVKELEGGDWGNDRGRLPRPRDLRRLPRRDAEVQARAGAHRQAPRRHGDGPQLEHRRQAPRAQRELSTW